mmetsp:Transcript_59678/g.153709  ORF Transcript_59678/g.153709 Transcript_59678/m.153709 type:complete len:331 (-) Transcript_59678:53-1045(-)
MADMAVEAAGAARPDAGRMSDGDREVQLTARWGALSVPVVLAPADWETLTFGELKRRLDAEINVPFEKMRLMGITTADGRPAGDGEQLKALTFKKPGSFMLIGTARENQLQEAASQEKEGDHGSVIRTDLHLQRLQAAIQATEITVLNPPREGTRLLVLDLDYTLFDCKSSAPINQCKRPFTDEMLSQVYPFYDIVIWSQTKWHWVEAKLTELGMLTHPRFQISFCMDRSSMFTVTSTNRRGDPRIHEVKALEVIWAQFPSYGPKNTVHVDDLGRNFAMNPRNGIEVTPFRVKTGAGDSELEYLAAYLLSLTGAEDLSKVDHASWRSQFL